MPNLEMNGPYELTNEIIDSLVNDNKMGNYALGYVKNKTFYVVYVGRSDTNLNARLKDHVGEKEKYKCFKFSYATSIKSAYEKECQNWHDFGDEEGQLDNKIHPDKPADSTFACPVCEE